MVSFGTNKNKKESKVKSLTDRVKQPDRKPGLFSKLNPNKKQTRSERIQADTKKKTKAAKKKLEPATNTGAKRSKGPSLGTQADGFGSKVMGILKGHPKEEAAGSRKMYGSKTKGRFW